MCGKNHILMWKVYLLSKSVPLILTVRFAFVHLSSQCPGIFEESLALLLFLMKSIVLIQSLVITSKLKAGHPVI